MEKLKIKTTSSVAVVFNKYPDTIRKKIINLRRLIVETASEVEEITNLEETLKWGEPSYLTKKGSTIRIDWKKKNPNQYAIYFNCSSRLVETFKMVYRDIFVYEGNRAIIFQIDEDLPEDELKGCIKASLTYHSIKKSPMLGL